jgi:hypothetical protein
MTDRRSIVVVSRRWHEPAIHVHHVSDGIEIEMSAADFRRAHQAHLAYLLPPWWKRPFLTRKAWDRVIGETAGKSFETVTGEMKQATIYSPPPIRIK